MTGKKTFRGKSVEKIILLLVLISLYGFGLPVLGQAQTPEYGGGKMVVGVEVQEEAYLGEKIPIRIDLSSGGVEGYPYVEYYEGGFTRYEAEVNVAVVDPQNEIVENWNLVLREDDIDLDEWDRLSRDCYGMIWQVPENGRFGLYTVHVFVHLIVTFVTYGPPREERTYHDAKSSMDSLMVKLVKGDFLLEIDVQDRARPGETIPIRIIVTQTSYPLPRISTEQGFAVSVSMAAYVLYPDGTVAANWTLNKVQLLDYFINTFNYTVPGLIILNYEVPSDAPSGSYTAFVNGEVLFSLMSPNRWIVVNRQYAQAEAKFEVALVDYEQLEYEYERLNASYKSFLTEFETLEDVYGSLKSKYNALESSYTSLKDTHNGLQTIHEELRREYETNLTEVGTFRTLTYVFITTTIAFTATSIYFLRKRSKAE